MYLANSPNQNSPTIFTDEPKILGHHSILTTARYTHLTGQTKHHATDRINTLMNGFTIAWGAAR